MLPSIRREYILRLATRPVWFADDGGLRVGRSSDLVEMLEALGIRTRA